MEGLIFYGQWTNLHDPSQNGPKHVTNAWIDWFLTFIIHLNTTNIVMWVTLQNNADWDCFKTLILRETLRIQNQLLEEHCACLEVIHLFQEVGSVQQNPKSSLWTLDWDWRTSCSRVVGSDCFCFRKHDSDYREKRSDLLSLTEVRDLQGRLTRWIILIVFPQTSSLRIKKLCCMCLRTTKQWSRWSLQEGVPQWDMFPGPHWVALDWLLDRSNLDPKIQIKYIDTKNQLADILTEGYFTRDEWNHLLCLFNISHFSATAWSDTMTKTISTRFRWRTSHSKIATNDESYCKGAVARIILDFIKPVEEKLWKSRSLDFNC